MCGGGPSYTPPAAPVVPDAPKPLVSPETNNSDSLSNPAAAAAANRKGRNALKIDLAPSGGSSSGTGLNIPS